MIAAIWILLSTTWLGHLGVLFLPANFVMDLLMGSATLTHRLVFMAALVPQIILVPWAWNDSAQRITDYKSRRRWRAGFFFTGFVAVTWYLLKRPQSAQL